MLDSKFLFTLVGLFVAVFAICNTNMSPAISEGFIGQRGVKVMREVHPNKGSTNESRAIKQNYQSMLGNDKFYSQPNYQSPISPRFNPSMGLGSKINYNLPDYKNRGVFDHPLGMADMAKKSYNRENFHSGESSSSNDMIHSSKENIVSDGLIPVPISDMTTIGSDGQEELPHVYERFVFSHRKSNLAAQGDFIRGDLPITPCVGSWFNVSVTPHIDLQQGAMNVIGGNNNDTSKALGEMMYQTSGRTNNTFAGVDMSHEYGVSLGAGMSDITLTGSPI
jgi:hypothetical protein